MVRVGTLPFRLLALRHGADLVYTEEIIDKKLMCTQRYENKDLNTIDFVSQKDHSVVLRIREEEKESLVWQIGSNNPETVLKAAKIVEQDVRSIDINMGCPEHFSVHAGMGAGLLKTPDIAFNILENLTKNMSIPISCKTRLLPKYEDWVSFVAKMQTTGIEHLTTHCRIREEMSRGHAHWSALKSIQSEPEINIPIFISGDWFSSQDAMEIKKYTNTPAILIARGACHNPAIFEQIKTYWENPDNITNHDDSNPLYDEHKIPLSEWNLESLTQSNNDTQPIIEIKEGESKNKAKKRAKKLLKKLKESKTDDNKADGKQSKILTKIIETRNGQCEVYNLCKEYLQIAIECGNKFGNTKYVLNYTLRTHKDDYETFVKVNYARNYQEMAKVFDLEEYLEEKLDAIPNLEQYLSYTYYGKMHKKSLNMKKQKITEDQ